MCICRLCCFALLLPFMVSCLESNPQPSPGGSDQRGNAWAAPDTNLPLDENPDVAAGYEVVPEDDLTCAPTCGGRSCGDDGCGGECGVCDTDCDCDGFGKCVHSPDYEILKNRGFEDQAAPDATRPPYWYIGFRDDPLPPESGTWAMDDAEVSQGAQSLRLDPTGYMAASQILHLPGGLLEGRSVSLSLKVRHQGLTAPPEVLLFAVNPEGAADPILDGIGSVGSWRGIAGTSEDQWEELSGGFTAEGPATAVAVVLRVFSDTGSVWFDDLDVVADPWSPGAGPDSQGIPAPLGATFHIGFVSESPMDYSETGIRELVLATADTGEILNLFFHVRWCALTDIPFEDDPVHAVTLEMADLARESGLKLALTLDFTHDSLEGIGELNPRPDGESPGSLLEEAVRDAYIEELLWLYEQTEAEVVIVGIEVDMMYEKHPEWWDAYVEMEGEIYDLLKQDVPAPHVTAYHTLEWSVDADGDLREDRADIWRQLLPKIDSIAYSTYPNVSLAGVPPEQYPEGYFSRASDIAPDLPILIPEFGMVGGQGAEYTEKQQADVLRQMLTEFDAAGPVAVIWYGLHDQLFLGTSAWFQQAFRSLGMHRLDGTPKEVFVMWEKLLPGGR